ncbi:hypothetical protein [Embleya hyalina]|uniref:Uncharacterized protein n=1 Tax=Embleya hyalina TaxID=516124 RepID=A0A401YLQ3_9ACTN|nr:hypothetical protein [Embleya hyalina]GCD95534.1 hypothetical protein EHYA_03208 [Embleya hyalina]
MKHVAMGFLIALAVFVLLAGLTWLLVSAQDKDREKCHAGTNEKGVRTECIVVVR